MVLFSMLSTCWLLSLLLLFSGEDGVISWFWSSCLDLRGELDDDDDDELAVSCKFIADILVQILFISVFVAMFLKLSFVGNCATVSCSVWECNFKFLISCSTVKLRKFSTLTNSLTWSFKFKISLCRFPTTSRKTPLSFANSEEFLVSEICLT